MAVATVIRFVNRGDLGSKGSEDLKERFYQNHFIKPTCDAISYDEEVHSPN